MNHNSAAGFLKLKEAMDLFEKRVVDRDMEVDRLLERSGCTGAARPCAGGNAAIILARIALCSARAEVPAIT